MIQTPQQPRSYKLFMAMTAAILAAAIAGLTITTAFLLYLVSLLTAPPVLEYLPIEGIAATVCEGEPLQITIDGYAHGVANRTEISHTIYVSDTNRVAIVLPEPAPAFSGNPLGKPGPFELPITIGAVADLEPGVYTYSRTALVLLGTHQDSTNVAFYFQVVDCSPKPDTEERRSALENPPRGRATAPPLSSKGVR